MKKVATAHLEELGRKIKEMQSTRKTLQHLVHCCQGNERPDCPILDELSALRSMRSRPRKAEACAVQNQDLA